MEMIDLDKELLELYILAGSASTPNSILRVLADHFSDKIRMRVAENRAASPEILFNLSHDQCLEVQAAAACNPSCDASVIDRLVTSSCSALKHQIAQRVETPVRYLEILAEDDNGWVQGEALKTLEFLQGRPADEVARRRQMRLERVTPSNLQYEAEEAS